jgi:predicted dehydrogenase
MAKILRCGIAGFGFIGPHHADAMRRLGFIEVAGICTSEPASARRKAEQFGIPRAFETFEDMVLSPEIDVVDIVTPTYLHNPMAMAAIAAGKHVIVDKPLALNSPQARHVLDEARAAGITHAVTFNYRHNPMVQQARVMIRRGDLGELHLIHGQYLQEWLLYDTDFNWRVEPEKAGDAAMMADAGCHWFDLVEYVTGLRVESVLADFSTTLSTRKRPASGRREAFAAATGEPLEDYEVKVPDRGTVLIRFDNGARGMFATSALCAGHKNDLRLEVNGRNASLAWEQEKPNLLWIGKRDEPDHVITRDPGLLDPSIRHYAALPGGHNEAWPDAFRNLMREIFTSIRSGEKPTEGADGRFPTFADGYRAACIADAMLTSSRAGGVWTSVRE